MTTSSATIETLEASVQVLKMGSRQVTSGVYKQLDHAKFEDIDPFGRVYGDSPSTCTEVIGRHKDTGVLVKCFVLRANYSADGSKDFHHWMKHGYLAREVDREGTYIIGQSAHGQDVTWWFHVGSTSGHAKDCWENCKGSTSDEARLGKLCDLEGLESSWRETATSCVAQINKDEQNWNAAKDLPLIILAAR